MSSNDQIREILMKERNALLDLSTRNRLLNIPLRTQQARIIEVVDEKSQEIVRLLQDGKGLTFRPGRTLTEQERQQLEDGDFETGGIPQPDIDDVDERGVAKRHTDTLLQTRLTSEGLQKRLFNIWYDSRTLEEEQGVNILFLAVGLLRWYEAPSSETPRHAPLVLVPVSLERHSASEKFKLKMRGEPLATNITLQAKLKSEFAISIEDASTDDDEFDIAAYLTKIAALIAHQPRWEVQPDAMVLGFFSFAKFLMYRDLDPALWPEEGTIDQHPLINALLRDGFPDSEPIVANDDAPIDQIISPRALNHVMDADSSQALAIEEAAAGRTIVIKGPPGTGKSQTIANIIAASVARGRTVLFVAEKMAALDVVHRRLKQVGLGAMALELHSNKVNKRQVLDELRRTEGLSLKLPKGDATVIEQLGATRDRLNRHAKEMHLGLLQSGYSAFDILGHALRTRLAVRDDIVLKEAAEWSAADRRERETLVRDLEQRLPNIGVPKDNPWFGVECSPMGIESEGLPRRIANLQKELAGLRDAATTIADALSSNPPQSLSDLRIMETLGAVAVSTPAEADRTAFANPMWENAPTSLEEVVEVGRRYSIAKSAADALFNTSAWSADFATIRKTFLEKGASLFRIFDSAYRAQHLVLRLAAKNPLPKQLVDRLKLIDTMIEAQSAREAFESVKAHGTVFGALWREDRSDWELLSRIVGWRLSLPKLPAGFLLKLSLADLELVTKAHSHLVTSMPQFGLSWDALEHDLALDLKKTFGVEDSWHIPLEDMANRISTWQGALPSLSRYILFAGRCRDARECGLAPLVDALTWGRLDGVSAFAAWEAAYFDALRTELFEDKPEMRAFDGDAQNRLVHTFRQLDLARIALAREQIAHKHADDRPRGPGLGQSPLGVLKGELAKKSRHLPIRQLIDKAGPAIQKLKPVFMMSPLSVAQFLRPGGIQFDILLMDEASQIEPVDALGAVARAKQVVVVGDERQLPPTRFFAKLTSNDEERDEDAPTFDAKDVESILELCLAKGAPHRMLNWHYRSKHQSLISVSNHEFYQDRLMIVPSPFDTTAAMGLKLHHNPDAHYDRGNTRTNPIEAKKVADAVIRHAREHSQQSLGVAAFSVAQRSAILKELEVLRRANPDLEQFFSNHSAEPFFVKNLENIQGDERDVIFISVGYGKTSTGTLSMNFGPLSSDGGERRLNVLISRAKLRCEVFTSILADDIDLERAKSRGVAAFKTFLLFVQTGQLTLGDVVSDDSGSVFEEQVAQSLREKGYDVRSKVGTAGFYLDLAIADPASPGRYILGIECDGAQYHASRAARDRDRLRQQILEAHDWITHRIWSVDWYLRPQDELAKVEAAIADAAAIWAERDAKTGGGTPVTPQSTQTAPDVFENEEVSYNGMAEDGDFAVPYREAWFNVNRAVAPHETPRSELVAIVQKIVELEGPVHTDEVIQRVRSLWDLGRAGSRIRGSVEQAIDAARARGFVVGRDFLNRPNGGVTIRDRSEVQSAGLRKPEYLPPAEIDEAILKLVSENFGAAEEGLDTGVARLFGYSSTSTILKAAIDARIRALIANNRLVERSGFLLVPR